MKGQLLKDIMVVKQMARTYLLVLGVWVFLGVMQKNIAMVAGFMMMFTIMVPLNAVSYDEKAKWDRYALTMPVTRTDLVVSKYLLAGATAFATMLISIALGMVDMQSMKETLITAVAVMFIGLVVVALILPIVFKIGVEKARMIMMLIMLLPVALIFLLARLDIKLPDAAALKYLAYASPLIALGLVGISILISIRIFEKKEF